MGTPKEKSVPLDYFTRMADLLFSSPILPKQTKAFLLPFPNSRLNSFTNKNLSFSFFPLSFYLSTLLLPTPKTTQHGLFISKEREIHVAGWGYGMGKEVTWSAGVVHAMNSQGAWGVRVCMGWCCWLVQKTVGSAGRVVGSRKGSSLCRRLILSDYFGSF